MTVHAREFSTLAEVQAGREQVQQSGIVTRILFRAFAAMACGAIFLCPDKRVLHLNDRARRCLEDCLATSASGRLVARDRGSDASFQTILDDALEGLASGSSTDPLLGSALGLARSDRQPLIIRVVPIEAEARAVLEGAALLVVMLDPEECPEPTHDLLRDVFGLTRGEARLACRLLCGETLNEIAGRSGVTLGTVRSQAKALFHKTRTNRQAELVTLLTRVAMIAENCDARSPRSPR
ncbi:helix-turn-helix transcriptional regulator [Micromonospora sp. STR1s_5]|nr:helix-turn-helix transcriptional regulator [Micromonospora sp. STR1s_5]